MCDWKRGKIVLARHEICSSTTVSFLITTQEEWESLKDTRKNTHVHGLHDWKQVCFFCLIYHTPEEHYCKTANAKVDEAAMAVSQINQNLCFDIEVHMSCQNPALIRNTMT